MVEDGTLVALSSAGEPGVMGMVDWGQRGHTRADESFLLVSSDASFLEAAHKQYRGFGTTRAATSLALARDALGRDEWTAMIGTPSLVDGMIWDLLSSPSAKARAPVDSVMVCGNEYEMASRPSRGFAASRVLFAGKGAASHGRFARRTIAVRYVRDEVADRIADAAVAHDLSAMQTRILALQVSAVPRTEWPELLGVRRNTIKTHVKRLCTRTNARSVADVAAPIVRALMERAHTNGGKIDAQLGGLSRDDHALESMKMRTRS